MDQPNPRPPSKVGRLTKLLLKIAGVNEEFLHHCPQQDWDNVRAVAEIMCCAWLYQTGLFYLVTQKIIGATEKIKPELVFVSAFIATFLLLNDSYMFVRSEWYLFGIEQLKHGGIDISGGAAARIKARALLVVRILLSVGIAQLTAIFLGLIIFSSDISPLIQRGYVGSNAGIIAAATTQVDAEIKQAADALSTETAREGVLASQVSSLRQDKIDPSVNRTDIQQAVQATAQLMLQKNAANEAFRRSQAFASDELAGIRGTQDNSGIPGDGPRRRAATEAVANAQRDLEQTSAALETAQSRLDAMRQRSVSSNEAAKQQSQKELPGFESALSREESKVQALREDVDRLTSNRDDAIRAAVEDAPNHIPAANGLLSQIQALERLAQGDSKIAAVIILIDLTTFGFELAAVLAKVTCYVPTTYSALLARDSYMRVVRLVDGMITELNGESMEAMPGPQNSPATAPPAKSNTDTKLPTGSDPFGNSPDPFSSSVKRPRGRPPKPTSGERPENPLPFGNGLAPDAPEG